MARKRIALRPNLTGGRIQYLHVGPVWTEIKVVVRTDRLQVQTAKQEQK